MSLFAIKLTPNRKILPGQQIRYHTFVGMRTKTLDHENLKKAFRVIYLLRSDFNFLLSIVEKNPGIRKLHITIYPQLTPAVFCSTFRRVFRESKIEKLTLFYSKDFGNTDPMKRPF